MNTNPDPDHTHGLITQDVMNERAKMEAPMSAAQFWWNHLTYAQREFIMKHVPPLSFIIQCSRICIC
jgi:hypothetical protein